MIEILNTKTICDKAFFPTNRIYLKHDDTKYHRDYVDRLQAVSAVVYDTIKKKYLFVDQFRPGTKTTIVELVAGMIDNINLSPLETIKKEILEELGYKTDHVEYITKSFTCAGYSNEIIYYYYTEVSKKIEKGGGVDSDNEFIKTIELDINELKEFNFQDSKCFLVLGLLGKLKSSKINKKYDNDINKIIRIFKELNWKNECDRNEAKKLLTKTFN